MEIRDARRILLCLRYGIGDLIMQLPVLDALRSAAPSAHITALGARPAIELLDRGRRADAVVASQSFGFAHWGSRGTQACRRAFGQWLDASAFDLVLDPSHAVLGARETMWQRTMEMRDADSLEARSAAARGVGGIAAIKSAVRAGWGMDVPDDVEPCLELSDEDRRFASRFLRDESPGRLRAGISPVASSELKRWPPARLAAVADGLVRDLDASLLLFADPEGRAADALLRHMRRRDAVTLVRAQTLPRAAALLARCRVFLCNDTGLMHLAAAVGARVVAAFGPTSPAVYLPPGGIAVSADSAEIPCRSDAWLGPSHCQIAGRCARSPHCIARVPVEAFETAAHRALASPALARARALHAEP